MITEYENEPIPGLPGLLPQGERILWQGGPDRATLARTAFHTRLIAGYFALLAGAALISALSRGGGLLGVEMTAAVGLLGVALLNVLAFLSARSTIYTLTDRRIVLRIGMALPTCINLPLAMVGTIDLATRADGVGDIPLTIIGPQRLGYAGLWPHARPWRLAEPQPMLRSIRDAARVAALIARTCIAADPTGAGLDGNVIPIERAREQAAFGEAVAA